MLYIFINLHWVNTWHQVHEMISESVKTSLIFPNTLWVIVTELYKEEDSRVYNIVTLAQEGAKTSCVFI